ALEAAAAKLGLNNGSGSGSKRARNDTEVFDRDPTGEGLGNPQVSEWLRGAIASTITTAMTTFGEHIDERIQTVEQSVKDLELTQNNQEQRLNMYEATQTAMGHASNHHSAVIEELRAKVKALEERQAAAARQPPPPPQPRRHAQVPPDQFTMGNLGFDTHRDILETRAREVLQRVGAPEPQQLRAVYTYGSIVSITYTDIQIGQRVRERISTEQIQFDGVRKNVWFDFRKSNEDLRPGRLLRRGVAEAERLEDREGFKGKVEGCPRSKKVYVQARVVGEVRVGRWHWTSLGLERYAADDLPALADAINVQVIIDEVALKTDGTWAAVLIAEADLISNSSDSDWRSGTATVGIVFTHAAHGDLWEESLEDGQFLLRSGRHADALIWLGDFNVDGNVQFGRDAGEEKQKWPFLLNVIGATGLQSSMQETAPTYTWTPTGEQQGDPSWLDHCFASAGVVTPVHTTWDSAPGDHSWLIVGLAGAVQPSLDRHTKRVWHCTDWEAYERELDTLDGDTLTSVSDITQAVQGIMDKYTDVQTSRQRRRTREPLQIKDTLDLKHKADLNSLLTDMRKQWLTKKWDIEGVDRARRLKRLPSPRSGLHAITSMKIGPETVHDHAAWATACHSEMERRWTEANASHGARWMERDARGTLHTAVPFDTPDVRVAISSLRKNKRAKDRRGLCPAAFRGQAGASLAKKAVNLLLVDDSGWEAVELEGYSKSKVAGVALPTKIRTIVLQNTILSVCHACVHARIVDITSAWSAGHGLDALVLGGSKHHQPAEVTFACSQVVEKSMDRRNAGAVGSMDVANFHDCLGWDSACDSMARRSAPEADAMMLMRLHSRPQVRIRVADALTDVVERSRGAFTGARTAATIGQWVVEDAFLDCAGDLAVRGWALEEGRYVTAMAWADNLISFGDSVHEAAGVLTIIEGALNLKGHTIKPDSRELLQVSQQPVGEWQLEAGGCAWQVKDELVVIGRTVSGNASSHADRSKALEKIQRSWFKHRRLLQNNALPFASRAQMWTRHAESIFNFYAGTWVLGRQMVNALDTVQLRH
ncbi:unnamed protein product, partial [Prorocentrum cordatum]